MKRVIYLLLDAVCLIVFAVSSVRWSAERRELGREAAQFQRLAAQVQTDRTATAADDRKILPQYASLYQEDPYLFGWVRIPGIAVDLPVMYSPDEPERYLHRAFDRSSSFCGTPFMDAGCDPSGSYFLIYGHHMKDGSMFGALPGYADASYWMLHPEILLDTLYEERRYQIFAMIYASTDDEIEKPYYAYRSLPDRETFKELIDAQKLYDTGIVPEYGDRILLLSTCSYHTENGWMAVAAVERRP